MAWLVAHLTACGEGTSPGVDVDRVHVQPNPLQLFQHQWTQVRVTALDAELRPINGVPVRYELLNPDVVSATPTGVITGRRAATSTVVRVHVGDRHDDVTVWVDTAPHMVVISPGHAQVAQDGALQLSAVVTDDNANAVPGAPVTWVSDAPWVAAVSATGLLVPAGPVRDVTIRATSGDRQGMLTVLITAVPTRLDVSPSSVTLTPTGSVQLQVIVRDAIDVPIPGAAVTYERENSLITVSPEGQVQAQEATGASGVIVRAAGLTTRVPVVIADAVNLAW